MVAPQPRINFTFIYFTCLSCRVPALPVDSDLHTSSSSTIIADGMTTSSGVCCYCICLCFGTGVSQAITSSPKPDVSILSLSSTSSLGLDNLYSIHGTYFYSTMLISVVIHIVIFFITINYVPFDNFTIIML